MSVSLISVLTFASVTLCIVGVTQLVVDLFVRDRSRVRARFQEEFNETISKRAQASPLFRELKSSPADAPLGTHSLRLRLQTLIDQAGLGWTTTHFLIATVAFQLFCGLALWLLTQSLIVAAVALAAGGSLPLTMVFAMRRRRRMLLCRQLPDAFDVMSRALKAGQTVSSAFQVIAQDFPVPIAEEFSHCYEQQHLGIPQEVALRDLARRTGVMELQIFVVAMIVHCRSGGNLAELLAKLATLLRKRASVQGRVRALTGEGRMQAVVLTALPAVVFGFLYMMNREYAQILLDRPFVLLGCVTSQAIGAACIHKLIQVDY